MEKSPSESRRGFIWKSGVALLGAPAMATVGHAQPIEQEKPFALRFAIASDGHFGQPNTDYQKFHRQMMHWLNEENRGKGLDFVVFNGDLIHDDPQFLPEVKQAYDQLDVPYYVTKGNHDRVSPHTWEETWGYGQNHDFEMGDYAFLLGTTSNEKGEYLCADIDWLKGKLEAYQSKKHVFVFLHINQNKVTKHGIDCPEVTDLLESTPNVAAVFHGHDHYIDNVVYGGKLPYLFDGHLGGSWGTNYRGYRIVEINQEGQAVTYQCNPEAFIVNEAGL